MSESLLPAEPAPSARHRGRRRSGLTPVVVLLSVLVLACVSVLVAGALRPSTLEIVGGPEGDGNPLVPEVSTDAVPGGDDPTVRPSRTVTASTAPLRRPASPSATPPASKRPTPGPSPSLVRPSAVKDTGGPAEPTSAPDPDPTTAGPVGPEPEETRTSGSGKTPPGHDPDRPKGRPDK
ncbi:hypothetical protein ACIBH1_23030 [Nonomuraea sp. NPDC050663]|uniref:hypothetical protein n=1 Tax=Nonomuraea sp. NPDC050663 TaxID=3364370 RepID=UPI0037B8D177